MVNRESPREDSKDISCKDNQKGGFSERVTLDDFPDWIYYDDSFGNRTKTPYPLKDFGGIIASSSTYLEGNLPGDRWDEEDYQYGALARVNMWDFTQVEGDIYEDATASATAMTGAFMFLSYGKNSEIEQINVMDLGDHGIDVSIENPVPADNLYLATGIDIHDPDSKPLISSSLAIVGLITAPINLPTSISVLLAAGEAGRTFYDIFKIEDDGSVNIEVEYRSYVEKPGEHIGQDKIERILQGKSIRDWGDDGSQTNKGSIDGPQFVHEETGDSWITDGKFLTNKESGEIKKDKIEYESETGDKKTAEKRFLLETYNKKAPVGSRIDFEMVLFISGKMINELTNQQVTGTVLLRQSSSDPYLLKNIELKTD